MNAAFDSLTLAQAGRVEALRPPSAEAAYLFRHALLRDAAYQLQLPGDRARLHGLAFELIEALAGGRAPEPPPPELDSATHRPHRTDAFSSELAEHAKRAGGGLSGAHRLYVHRAALFAERNFRPAAAQDLWRELSEISEGATRAAAITRAGGAALRLGRAKVAEAMFREALDLAKTQGARRVEGVAIEFLAILARETGRLAEAERLQEEALAIHREVGNRRCEGLAYGSLAILYAEARRFGEAERMSRQAVAIARETDDPGAAGIALGNMAAHFRIAGRMEEAERTQGEALEIARGLGDRRAEGMSLGNLAQVFRDTGRPGLAERAHEQALAMHREVGNRRFEGVALGNLATVYDEAGKSGEAERACREALAIFLEVGDRRHAGVALGNLAGILRRAGSREPVEPHLEKALAIHRETGNRVCEGLHLLEFSLLRLVQGSVAEARGLWRDAAEILRGIGAAAKLQISAEEMRAACAQAGVPALDEGPP
ncbi:MAG: tetratricopeptide repeat protein [Planctomycetota bacterium]